MSDILKSIDRRILECEELLEDMSPNDNDFKYIQDEIIRLREVRDEENKRKINDGSTKSIR